jgi:hypothetical protein
MAADFEDLDALRLHAERKIKLGADVRWRASPFDELSDQLLASLGFEFTERHD